MKKILFLILLIYSGFTQAQITLNSPIVEAGQFSADGKQYKLVSGKHVPYTDAADFLTTIPSTRRHIGQIAYVYDGSDIVTYHFVGGIADSNFKKVSIVGITDTALVRDVYYNDTYDSLIILKGSERIAIKVPVDSFNLDKYHHYDSTTKKLSLVISNDSTSSSLDSNKTITEYAAKIFAKNYTDSVKETIPGSDTTSLSNRINENATAIEGKLSNITGLITEGTNTTITGTGTSEDPYVISSSGGGSGDSFTTQTYTTGDTVTIADASNWLIVNPDTLKDSLTIILPESPVDREEVTISFGGTVTGGNDVVTNLTISANTDQGLIQNFSPTYFQSGEMIRYRYNSSTSKWYAQ